MILQCKELDFLHQLHHFQELFLIFEMSFLKILLREVSLIREHFINSAYHLLNYIQKAIQMTKFYHPNSKD